MVCYLACAWCDRSDLVISGLHIGRTGKRALPWSPIEHYRCKKSTQSTDDGRPPPSRHVIKGTLAMAAAAHDDEISPIDALLDPCCAKELENERRAALYARPTALPRLSVLQYSSGRTIHSFIHSHTYDAYALPFSQCARDNTGSPLQADGLTCR